MWTLGLIGCGLLGCDQQTYYAEYEGRAAFANQRADIETHGKRVGYISDSLSDTISVVDLDDFELIAQVPIGRDPVDIDGPHHLAVDRERGALYVALSYPALGQMGPHAGHGGGSRFGFAQMLALDDLRPLGELRVDKNPGDIVLSPDGQTLAITHYDLIRAQTETTLDAQRATLILVDEPDHMSAASASAERIAVCITPHSVAFSPDSEMLYVACSGEDSIVVVERASSEIVARVPVAEAVGAAGSPIHQPYSITLSPSGEVLIVGNIASNTLVVFDVDASSADEPLRRRLTLPMLGAAYFPSFMPESHQLIMPYQYPGGAARVDLDSGRIVAQIEYATDGCQNPHETAITSDGRVYVVCEGNQIDPGSVVEINPETLEIIASVEVGVFPDRLFVVEP